MRTGAAIANQLTPLKSATQVGKELGISDTMVRRIECQALYKIATRLVELREKALNE
jgi:hypothetical protein